MTAPVGLVTVAHDPAWRRWPDTADTDYGAILAARTTAVYPVGAAPLVVARRTYPAYLPHVRAGLAGAVPPRAFRRIDNAAPADPRVVAALARDLAALAADGCRALVWPDARNCPPAVAARLREWFDVAVLTHADDCPETSPRTTFPVAAGFDAVVHCMRVYDHRTGARVAPEYHARGLADARWKASNDTVGLREWMRDAAWSADAKLDAMARGALAVDLAFVGDGRWRDRPRAALLRALNADAARALPGWTVRLHGAAMRDDLLLPFAPPRGPGYVAAPLYADTLFGFNAPVASVYNCRLMDLWLTACVQVVLDPWGELPAHGFAPWEHYLPCPAEPAALFALLREWKARPADCARVAAAGRATAAAFLRERSTDAVMGAVLDDYLRGDRRRARR